MAQQHFNAATQDTGSKLGSRRQGGLDPEGMIDAPEASSNDIKALQVHYVLELTPAGQQWACLHQLLHTCEATNLTFSFHLITTLGKLGKEKLHFY